MDSDDIIAALESTAKSGKRGTSDRNFTPDRRETALYRDQLLRFLRELDTDKTVGEIIEALDGWA